MAKKSLVTKVAKEDIEKCKHSNLVKHLDNDIMNKVDYIEFTEDKGFVSARVIFKQDKKQEELPTVNILNKETQFNKDSDVSQNKMRIL